MCLTKWFLLNNLQSSNKRFQRLESHVVTLARSVAHLSSEMRTQHIMIQVRHIDTTLLIWHVNIYINFRRWKRLGVRLLS